VLTSIPNSSPPDPRFQYGEIPVSVCKIPVVLEKKKPQEAQEAPAFGRDLTGSGRTVQITHINTVQITRINKVGWPEVMSSAPIAGLSYAQDIKTLKTKG
jgi:hypothetical protein